MAEISLIRLYLLRASYLVLAVGLGLTIWPAILVPSGEWRLMNSVVASMLGALSLLAVFGLRFPLQMLPLLFFEMTWKAIWLVAIALPLWTADRLDAAFVQTVVECAPAVVFAIVIPWPYVYRTYVTKVGDPWRRRAR